MLPVNTNTKWRQVGTAFGTVSEHTDAQGPGDHAARIISTYSGLAAEAVGLAADNAQYYNLSSLAMETQARVNYRGMAIGLGVYDDTGDALCAGIGVGLWYDPWDDIWHLILQETDKYDPDPPPLDEDLISPYCFDSTAFHRGKAVLANINVH